MAGLWRDLLLHLRYLTRLSSESLLISLMHTLPYARRLPLRRVYHRRTLNSTHHSLRQSKLELLPLFHCISAMQTTSSTAQRRDGTRIRRTRGSGMCIISTTRTTSPSSHCGWARPSRRRSGRTWDIGCGPSTTRSSVPPRTGLLVRRRARGEY